MSVERIMKLEKDIKEHLTDLPDSPDHILVILKGHLLVEEEMNRILEAKLPNPDVLKLREVNGPKFFHKVCLLEALIPKPKAIPGLWDVIKELNKLRNDFGHQLSPKNIQAKTDKFIEYALESTCIGGQIDMKKFFANDMMSRLRLSTSLSIILSYLVEIREIAMSATCT